MKNSIINMVVTLAVTLFSTFNVHACLTNESESNNTESQANYGLCSQTTIAGDLGRNDTDWFEFDVTEAGTIDISLSHHSRDDFDWALYRSSGSAVKTAQTGNVPEVGSFQATSAETYFLKITRYSGRGWYDLDIDFPDGGGSGGTDCGYGLAPSTPANLTQYTTGNVGDSCGSLTANNGAVLLMGGGSDVDNAFSQRVVNHVGSGIDVVVLRTSGSDGYNDYLQGLMNADSVQTLIIDTNNKANSDYVEWAIRSAEFVFVSGGDQSDYLNQWTGTKVQSALQHVFDKGGVIGGTSAGMALMAASIYDPDGVLGAISEEVVTDFCHQTLNFSTSFVSIPMLDKTLTDTHFAERDRMGRILVSLAQHSSQHIAIAADEGTSLFVKNDNSGVVDGSGSVYIFSETSSTQRQTLSCGNPVRYNNVERIRLSNNDTINLATFVNNGTTTSVSINGNNANFYSPLSPY